MVIGVTGNLGTGKSTVSALLKEKGAMVIDADKIAHELMEPGKPAYQDIREFFGNSILREDGKIDRKQLGRQVFADKAKLKKLCNILHPLVKEECQEQLQRILKRDPKSVVVLDVPLLIESGMKQQVDWVIAVATTLENQLERSMTRLGLNKREALQRIQSQMSPLEKSKQADFVVSTSGSLDEIKVQIERLWNRLNR